MQLINQNHVKLTTICDDFQAKLIKIKKTLTSQVKLRRKERSKGEGHLTRNVRKNNFKFLRSFRN